MLPFRVIGKKIGSLRLDRSIVALQMMIVCLGCSTMIVESASVNSRLKRRHSYVYFSKNRQATLDENWRKERREYEGLYENNRLNEETNFNEFGRKSRHAYTRPNKMPRSIGGGYNKSGEMTRILTFPLMNDANKDQIIGFPPGDPAGECLEGGVDAGVVNGAVKIGIGLGLVPGCRMSTEQPPKLMHVPVFVPRPIPVPVPQPYPVAVDRPVPIRVPQPIPYPTFNMAPPMMRRMRPFPRHLMTGRDWTYGSIWK